MEMLFVRRGIPKAGSLLSSLRRPLKMLVRDVEGRLPAERSSPGDRLMLIRGEAVDALEWVWDWEGRAGGGMRMVE
jgi:hypothetical protein